MAIASVSIEITKRSGDRGHPCLVPLWICKRSDVRPNPIILADGFEYKALIKLRKFGPQFHYLNMWNRKGQDRVSKALCRSSDNSMPYLLSPLSQLERITEIKSMAHLIWSATCLPDTNPTLSI